MDIQAEKLQLIKLILETESPKVLESIRMLLLKEKNADFWDSLTSEQKHEIELGISEFEKGETIDYDLLIKKHRR